jgi:peptide/nickel transport system permease protein
MHRIVLRRILNSIPLLFLISLFSFVLIRSAPGDPVAMYLSTDLENADPDTVERVRESLGLNRPLIVQYWAWLGRAVQGDLGVSFVTKQPVTEVIFDVLPNSMLLAGISLPLAVIVGVSLGIITALRQQSWLDYVVTTVVFIGYSIPSFYLALLLLYFLSFKYQLVPSSGMRSLRMGHDNPMVDLALHALMPLLTYTFIRLVVWVRFQRNSLIDVLNQDYVRTARAKGLSERVVLLRHAWRNSLIPIITQLGLSFSGLVGGSFIIESIFAWPGIGRLGVEAIRFRDYPVAMGILLISSIMIIIGNLISDVSYMLLDPRVNIEHKAGR